MSPREKAFTGYGSDKAIGIRVIITLKDTTKISSERMGTKTITSRGTDYTYNIWDLKQIVLKNSVFILEREIVFIPLVKEEKPEAERFLSEVNFKEVLRLVYKNNSKYICLSNDKI